MAKTSRELNLTDLFPGPWQLVVYARLPTATIELEKADGKIDIPVPEEIYGQEVIGLELVVNDVGSGRELRIPIDYAFPGVVGPGDRLTVHPIKINVVTRGGN